MTQQAAADQGTFNNELRGVLFRNDKGDNPARPDYRGNCEVVGVKYKIAGWVRTSQKDGSKFLSLAFTEDATAPPATVAEAGAAPVEEPLPF